MEEELLVSICCIAYNHEYYINKTIEGFLMQITNFRYEILIHDDASTDSTQKIIHAYKNQFPDTIKPIYQTENQFSRGVNALHIVSERAVGKYIAICEGDDYWVDPYKLQKQVDYMEVHPECSMCVHAAHQVDTRGNKLPFPVRPKHENSFFTVEEVIEGGGGLFATNSILYRREHGNHMPEFYQMAPVQDYPLAITMAIKGKVYYLDEFMSAYRVGAVGSWTTQLFSDIEKKKAHFDQISRMLDLVNEYTNYQYNNTICRTKHSNQFYLLFEQRKFREAKRGEFRQVYQWMNFKQKVLLHLKYAVPNIYNSLFTLKRKIIHGYNGQ